MKNTYFSDMYYPQDRENLLSLCTCEVKEGHTPSLIMLPHSSLEYIHQMYQDAFGYVHKPKRIVIMAPIHGERFESDEGKSLFTLSSGDVETALGPVHIESVAGLPVNDSYAEEEYAIELFYPYVALNSPESTILPIFTKLEGKEDIQALSRLMVALKKEENDTLFIISGNFTSLGQSSEVNQMARTLKELLENNAPLIEAGMKKKISGCAYRMLEAARTAFPGKFSIIQARSGNYTGQAIDQNAQGPIWQVYAVKE